MDVTNEASVDILVTACQPVVPAEAVYARESRVYGVAFAEI
jgi:hypothetical protein